MNTRFVYTDIWHLYIMLLKYGLLVEEQTNHSSGKIDVYVGIQNNPNIPYASISGIISLTLTPSV